MLAPASLFPRSIAFHHDGSRARAIDDSGGVLQELSFDSPSGILLDSLALISVFVGGGDPSHDAMALEYIRQFEMRSRGVKRFRDVHTRRIWVEAHLNARLGNQLKASRQFRIAQVRLLADGLLREALAVTLDRILLKCRPTHRREDNLESAKEAIKKCLSFQRISEYRRSFIAPVACRFEERLLTDATGRPCPPWLP